MRLTIIVLAGITATTSVAAPVRAQERTHLSGAAALKGIAPLLYDHMEEAAIQRAFRSVLNLGSRTDYQRYSTNRRGMRPDVIVRRAYQDILGRDPDPEGLRTYRSNIIDKGWSEQDVREALRNSPEYASGGARTASADRIIRRAYQDILGREPDASGLETYRRNIIERGWDEQDVRTALRRSEERRGVTGVRNGRVTRQNLSDAEASDIVRRAYLSVLNREPDANGMRDYKARILNDRWTEQQVVNALRNSDEYRSKH